MLVKVGAAVSQDIRWRRAAYAGHA